MSRAQLHKSLKAFGHPPIAEQAARLAELQREYETAEQALVRLQTAEPVTAQPVAVKPDNSASKRAKIQLAMARAALKKAQANEASAEQLASLNADLYKAEHALESVDNR